MAKHRIWIQTVIQDTNHKYIFIQEMLSTLRGGHKYIYIYIKIWEVQFYFYLNFCLPGKGSVKIRIQKLWLKQDIAFFVSPHHEHLHPSGSFRPHSRNHTGLGGPCHRVLPKHNDTLVLLPSPQHIHSASVSLRTELKCCRVKYHHTEHMSISLYMFGS